MARIRTEALLTSSRGFGLTTASNLQRAICRVSDGQDIGDKLWRDPEVQDGFAGVRPALSRLPLSMVVLSAIRAAKSTIASCAAFRMSQTIDVSGVIPGDEIRIPVLSVDKDSATATYSKLVGAIMASPLLRERLVGEPTQDSVWLKHPAGPIVEIKVVALAKYGQTVVSRWLGGVIFDEGPLMAGEDSVKNLSEARRAVAGRILPGGQEWIIGSPWGAVGPVYDLVTEHRGKPTEDVVVVKAPGPAMNPYWWTPERCEAERKRDPKAFRTNVLAEFADPEEALFPSVLVEPAMRAAPDVLPPTEGVHYVAAIDPATRGNGWTLVVVGHYGYGGPGGWHPLLKVALAKQWRGTTTRPLDPDAVLRECAADLEAYGLNEAFTDQWSVDALKSLASRYNLDLHEITLDKANRLEFAEGVRTMLSLGTLELPPSREFRQDLVGIKKRIVLGNSGGYSLVLPKTGDGRHSDFGPPLFLCCAPVSTPEPPDEPLDDVPVDEGWFEQQQGSWGDVTNVLLTR